MIKLYTWSTPNGRKVSILLEELGVPYEVHPIDITKGAQFAPEFLEFSPNNKIPAIIDTETGAQVMESGAIMIYLAEKHRKFLPDDPVARLSVLEWLMWQMGGFGPMLGQAHHFLYYNKGKAPYAETRYAEEARRLYGVLDRRLAGREFVADTYSIADMAIWPWAARYQRQDIEMSEFPNVRDWYRRLAARPAVQRGYAVPDHGDPLPEA